jgi:hypothetical protein
MNVQNEGDVDEQPSDLAMMCEVHVDGVASANVYFDGEPREQCHILSGGADRTPPRQSL